ncbi:SDR family oxidoreductase [Fluviibacterium sp. DFM31]|uniref:SDR family oxidoreductase n=1 Tax=Meridianimarinicoccus marinus TaxID=3231483 RepID=A0ABV3L6X4_9RHOB
MIDLTGKSIFASAAGAGIGRAVAKRLLQGGARVHAVDLDGGALQSLQAEATAEGIADKLTIEALDATDPDKLAACAEALPDCNGLYNGVGWVHEGTLETTSRADWDRSWALNVTPMMEACRAFLPGMVARGGGSIVNVSSVASSLKAVPNRMAYSATKAAVLGLTKSIAADYVGQGIRVNALCPGTVDSPSLRSRIDSAPDPDAALAAFIARQPVGRLGTPEEMAEIVAFLLSDSAAYVTGTHFVLDGGITM